MTNFSFAVLPDTSFQFPRVAAKQSAMVQQLSHLAQALTYCPCFRHAIDGGAHCGLWSQAMARHFQHVSSFEPAQDLHEFFWANTKAFPHVTLFPYALGGEECRVVLKGEARGSLARYCEKEKRGDITMKRLDDFNFFDVDLLKLDLEGAEALALLGAQETIARSRPVIIVEYKNHGTRYDTVPFHAILEANGYQQVWKQKPDSIWVPGD